MSLSLKKAKIKWQCRRGMLELDLIFSRFLNNQLEVMSAEKLTAFENFLTHNDPDLYAWLMGYETPKDKEDLDFVEYIKLHAEIK